MRTLLAAMIAAFSSAGAASAADQEATVGFAAEAGLAVLEDDIGGEVGVGGYVAFNRFRLGGTLGMFVHASGDERYRSERFDDGRTICRDATSGQFADASHCGPDYEAYARLVGSIALTDRFSIGGGYRISEASSVPLGSVSFALTPHVGLNLQGGAEFARSALTVSF